MSDILERPAQLLDGHILLGNGVVGGTEKKMTVQSQLQGIESSFAFVFVIIIVWLLPNNALGSGPDGFQVLVPPEDGESGVPHFHGVEVGLGGGGRGGTHLLERSRREERHATTAAAARSGGRHLAGGYHGSSGGGGGGWAAWASVGGGEVVAEAAKDRKAGK